MEGPGSSPPLPVPRRALNYGPPNPFHPPRPFADMRRSVQPQMPAYPNAGNVQAGPNSRSTSMENYTNYVTLTSPSTPGQPSQQSRIPPGANTAYRTTLCFRDHIQRLALIVPGPELNLPLSVPPNRSAMQTGGFSTPPAPQQPSSPTPPGPSSQHSQAERKRAQITIQLYLHSPTPGFKSEHGLTNVDLWCRQLQCSMAFRHLKNQLSEHCGHAGFSPTIRIEVYEALPGYKDIVNHSLNEREYRGLQECYERILRFMRYAQRISQQPNFVMPEHMNALGKAELANMDFIKGQMEDIRNGDGGKHRRRRAALRERLAPAFDDGRGPGPNETMNKFGSNWSFNQLPTSAGPSMPARRVSEWSPPGLGGPTSAAISPSTVSTVRQSHSPQHGMNTQQTEAVPPDSLDPRLRRQRALMQPNQPQQGPQRSNAPQQATQQAQSRRAAPQAPPNLIPPPPTSAQGFQRPSGPPIFVPNPGSLAKPLDVAPDPLLPKSIYRGVAQPYHNLALVIDHPLWASTAGIGVLRFGYEADWADGENIQRSGACFERVGMMKGTGKRWLGDALADCFVGDDGDGEGGPPEWVRGWGDDVDGGAGERCVWPGGEGGTDEEFGIKSDGRPGDLGEETTGLLKKLQVPGAANVDFLGGEWGGLL